MENCLFCKIASGAIPATLVYDGMQFDIALVSATYVFQANARTFPLGHLCAQCQQQSFDVPPLDAARYGPGENKR